MTPPEPSTPKVEPVRITVRVRRNIEDTFDVFTRDISAWWPLDTASFGGNRAAELGGTAVKVRVRAPAEMFRTRGLFCNA